MPSAGGVVAEQNRQIMFTYLNPDVRKRLIAEGKLVRLDAQGQLIDVATPESPGELAINLLGLFAAVELARGGNHSAMVCRSA